MKETDRNQAESMKEQLMDVLREINPDADYENSETLVEDGELDSMQMLMLVVRLEEVFGITMDPAEISAENFNSVDQMLRMLAKYEKKDGE